MFAMQAAACTFAEPVTKRRVDARPPPQVATQYDPFVEMDKRAKAGYGAGGYDPFKGR